MPENVKTAFYIQENLIYVFFNRLGIEDSGQSPSTPDMEEALNASKIIESYTRVNEERICIREEGVREIYRFFDHYGIGLKELTQSLEALELITGMMKK